MIKKKNLQWWINWNIGRDIGTSGEISKNVVDPLGFSVINKADAPELKPMAAPAPVSPGMSPPPVSPGTSGPPGQSPIGFQVKQGPLPSMPSSPGMGKPKTPGARNPFLTHDFGSVGGASGMQVQVKPEATPIQAPAGLAPYQGNDLPFHASPTVDVANIDAHLNTVGKPTPMHAYQSGPDTAQDAFPPIEAPISTDTTLKDAPLGGDPYQGVTEDGSVRKEHVDLRQHLIQQNAGVHAEKMKSFEGVQFKSRHEMEANGTLDNIGEGDFSTVYSNSPNARGDKTVTKHGFLNTRQEIPIARLLGEAGIGPAVYDHKDGQHSFEKGWGVLHPEVEKASRLQRIARTTKHPVFAEGRSLEKNRHWDKEGDWRKPSELVPLHEEGHRKKNFSDFLKDFKGVAAENMQSALESGNAEKHQDWLEHSQAADEIHPELIRDLDSSHVYQSMAHIERIQSHVNHRGINGTDFKIGSQMTMENLDDHKTLHQVFQEYDKNPNVTMHDSVGHVGNGINAMALLSKVNNMGITHGDPHQGNLMVGPDGQFKALDCGLSKMGLKPSGQGGERDWHTYSSYLRKAQGGVTDMFDHGINESHPAYNTLLDLKETTDRHAGFLRSQGLDDRRNALHKDWTSFDPHAFVERNSAHIQKIGEKYEALSAMLGTGHRYWKSEGGFLVLLRDDVLKGMNSSELMRRRKRLIQDASSLRAQGDKHKADALEAEANEIMDRMENADTFSVRDAYGLMAH